MRNTRNTARHMMSTDVVSVVPSMTLRAAAAVLREHRITGAAVVTETGRLIGVLSETDLVDRQSQPRIRTFAVKPTPLGARHRAAKPMEVIETIEQPIDDITVGEVFSPYVITARPDTSLPSLAALMVRHRVHRVFILDGTALIGVVTSMDVMKAVATARSVTRSHTRTQRSQRCDPHAKPA